MTQQSPVSNVLKKHQRSNFMKKTRILFSALCMFALLSSCDRQNKPVDLQQQMDVHKARDYDSWAEYCKKPITDRIGPAPGILSDYLGIDNKLNGYTQTPKPATEWKGFAKDVTGAIDDLPQQIRGHLNAHAVGIFLVTDLGSTAYTESLREFSRFPMGVIVLDTEALDMKANDWATWRENTPFKASKNFQTTVYIARDQDDTRKLAISFIILHELGHLVGIAKGAHADWWHDTNPSSYDFSNISWRSTGKSIKSKWDTIFPERSNIKFYANQEKKVSAGRIQNTYDNLQKTDFVSLYAATGVYDDFAETYAMYVHVVMQHHPWQLTLSHDGNIIENFNAPIQHERCKRKKAYIASTFREKS